MKQPTIRRNMSYWRRLYVRVRSPKFEMAAAVLIVWGLAFYTRSVIVDDWNCAQVGNSWQFALSCTQRSLASEREMTRQIADLISDDLNADDTEASSDTSSIVRLQALIEIMRHQAQQAERDLAVVALLAPQFDDIISTDIPSVRIVADIRTSQDAVVGMAQNIADLWRSNRQHDARLMADSLSEMLLLIEKQSGALQKPSQQLFDSIRKRTDTKLQVVFWVQTMLSMTVVLGLTWGTIGNARQRLSEEYAGNKTPPDTLDNDEEPLDLAGNNILVVDDGACNRRLTATIASRMGARVSCAADGQQAVEMVTLSQITGEHFDLVLMDIDMPVLNGISATEKLRKIGYDGIIIAATGAQMDLSRETCLEAGCDEFFAKPFKHEHLQRTLATHLDSSTKRQS